MKFFYDFFYFFFMWIASIVAVGGYFTFQVFIYFPILIKDYFLYYIMGQRVSRFYKFKNNGRIL